MKLVVFSNAPIVKKDDLSFLYAPYEKEMQLWAKHAHSIQFCCPIWNEDRSLLIAPVSFEIQPTIELKDFNVTTFWNVFKAFPNVIRNFATIYKAMKNANHIHLRCPGNIGLLACLIQVLFPNSPKTAKYAGNWDPKAKQPFTYKIQKWILNNTFLTKNMQVLVYGEWEGNSKNIKPFFTATYSEKEITHSIIKIKNDVIHFMFVGMLSEGKRPLYAIQLIEELNKMNINVHLSVYGEGILRSEIEEYISTKNLKNQVTIFGNQTKDIIKEAYQNNHFLILPSKSEGWPKVVAEAMFFGCVPLTTNVSCVNYMIGNGSRGRILSLNLNDDVAQIQKLLLKESDYYKMSDAACNWSKQFTTEYFENEIKKLLTIS
ncbi:glycosyltransferase family 4 protein [Flavobacterium urocaniciphilum]|uniref:Glycosyltransferase involved in cell wall bisynthesis n=1 Tax=Flavobacterium urocaniciphilum TaxID=1299341 RepID=A0A1H8YS09_9FLAO|nr:glycosyltransferase [Flavobacterium urocaniciphilum]SEP54946.1 Glycosyltransferase involved in cell wall bisynthesis [Flavobacterium urocaniciphilum]